MTREKFQDALQRIELQLMSLGELAGASVQNAVRAVVEHDITLAQAVIDGDDEIDLAYLAIEQDVLSVLALQSPVAADLRLISAILHSCLHLERVGDQAVNIAKIFLATKDLPSSAAIRTQIQEMGDIVVRMIRTAMDAFARRDMALCETLPVMDDPVDRLNRATHLEALKLADDPRALDWGMHMNMAARALERVGDNAVDIGEQVGFLITGEFREFTDASHEVTRS
ncbi:MAG: phosphate signaling complex protein PhoU [Actinomycetota bacterium]